MRYFTTDATACKSTCTHAICIINLWHYILSLQWMEKIIARQQIPLYFLVTVGQGINVRIPIIDNIRHDGDRYFLF